MQLSKLHLRFDRNLLDPFDILDSTVIEVQGRQTHHQCNQEPQKHINTLINEHSCRSSLVLVVKVVLGRPGRGDMAQHLEGTMS